jgi:hypothetical protein
MTGDEVAGQTGKAPGHGSEGSILASSRHGLGGVCGGCGGGGPSGGCGATKRARASSILGKALLSSSVLMRTASQSSSSSVSSGGMTNDRPRSAA